MISSSPEITSKKPILPVVLFTVFIDLLGFGILIPVIPLLLTNPRSEYYLLPAGYTFQEGLILLGFLLGLYSLAQFFATPILGQLSDRYGRRPILIISLIGTALSYFLFGYGIIIKSLPLLFFSRILDGITGGNISVAQAVIADITKPQDRAKTFGFVGAAFGLGFILGPYIGGKLSDPAVVSWFNAATPFWFAGILASLNVLFVAVILPETLKEKVRGKAIKASQAILNVVSAFKMADLRALFLTSFLFNAGFAFFTQFFAVYLQDKFNYTQGNTGDFFSYIGLWIAIAQAVVTRAVGKRFEDYKILRFSMFFVSAFIAANLVASKPWMLFVIAPFFAISNGLTTANLTGLVSKSAGPDRQGAILGINSSLQALGGAIPAMLSGFIAAKIGTNAPAGISSLVIFVAALFFALFYKPTKVGHAE